jgi:hypothetical protein
MYQTYRDIAEFRIVYINEAHAADGSWPMPIALEKGIVEHKNLGDRCATAKRLLEDKRLSIPCLIDGMDNAVNESYGAWPDRIFVVRTDGRLAVAAAKGPRGFKPGLKAAEEWLARLRESGNEPPLDSESLDSAHARERKSAESADAQDASDDQTDRR